MLFLTKEDAQTIREVSLQVMDFHCDIISYMFLHYLWKRNTQNKDEFFSKYDEFLKEVSVIPETFFFTIIAGNIYVNRR